MITDSRGRKLNKLSIIGIRNDSAKPSTFLELAFVVPNLRYTFIRCSSIYQVGGCIMFSICSLHGFADVVPFEVNERLYNLYY